MSSESYSTSISLPTTRVLQMRCPFQPVATLHSSVLLAILYQNGTLKNIDDMRTITIKMLLACDVTTTPNAFMEAALLRLDGGSNEVTLAMYSEWFVSSFQKHLTIVPVQLDTSDLQEESSSDDETELTDTADPLQCASVGPSTSTHPASALLPGSGEHAARAQVPKHAADRAAARAPGVQALPQNRIDETIAKAFQRYDFDHSGTISAGEELTQLTLNLVFKLELNMTVEYVDTVLMEMKDWETDQDSSMDLQEYTQLFKQKFMHGQ